MVSSMKTLTRRSPQHPHSSLDHLERIPTFSHLLTGNVTCINADDECWCLHGTDVPGRVPVALIGRAPAVVDVSEGAEREVGEGGAAGEGGEGGPSQGGGGA
jgi:hypothetical protein